MYAAIALASALLCFALLFARSQHEQKKQQKAVESFVEEILYAEDYRPEASVGSTYGTPSFTPKFASDSEKQHAVSKGLTEQFIGKVQKLCEHLSPRNETFDASRAVAIYSEDDEQRWAAMAAPPRSDQDHRADP